MGVQGRRPLLDLGQVVVAYAHQVGQFLEGEALAPGGGPQFALGLAPVRRLLLRPVLFLHVL